MKVILKRARGDEWPFFVKILLGKKLLCGGAIFGPFGIVTAAHCLQRISPNQPITLQIGPSKSPLVLRPYHVKRLVKTRISNK